jgi:sterol desaturase/sphingolipid hydroxylase (fatty acid hydroxylase superfamily)
MLGSIFAAALGLVGLALVFGPLEWAFPAWANQSRWRKGFRTDLAFLLGQQLVFASLTVGLLAALLEPLRGCVLLEAARAPFAALPVLARVLIALLLGDLALYWAHRLQHRSNFLWRFHGVHHSAPALDFLAAHREHPLDGIYTRLVVNLPAVALDLPLAELMGLVTFRGLWATFIHANVSIPLGPLQMLVGSPRLHHWHHARQRDAGNYANLAPFIDWLFGTYRCPEKSPTRVGTREPWPQTYLGLLAHPFRRRRRTSAALRCPPRATQ